MIPTASIVCGIDHSPGARAAAGFAGELADRLDLRLVLVHAVQPPIPQSRFGLAAPGNDWEVIRELRRAGTSLLEETANALAGHRDVVTELKLGDASSAIAATAGHVSAVLVAVGSRGLGAVGALILGSVSRRLAVEAPCPTVIVPESAGAIADAPVLCAVDDSEEAPAALAIAATLAQRLDVELLLAHAEPDGADTADGKELLARVVEGRQETSVETMVLTGQPADAIVEAAVARSVALIVIGSRGRGALASAALGSVSSAVAARAPCPVAIVRADTRLYSGFAES